MKILDKNSDFYDYLSFSELSNDELTFDRRGSLKLTKKDLCVILDDNLAYSSYSKSIKGKRGSTYIDYNSRYYEIALAAGTNLFIILLSSLHYEQIEVNGKKENVLTDFSARLLCERKNYERDLGILNLYLIEGYKRNSRYSQQRYSYAFSSGNKGDWAKANLNNATFINMIETAKEERTCYPILLGTGLCDVLSAESVYNGIEEYLFAARTEKNQESKGLNDEGKIINHGFDTKTSFRNIK